jgi:DNA-binding GntR family transcriptional regulator
VSISEPRSPDPSLGGLAPLRHDPAALRRKIVAALRQAIEAGDLPPGARLVERELCEQLGVSRTSLREALRELEAEGALSREGGRGVTVRAFSPQETENALAVQRALEELVTSQFERHATDAERRQLRQASERLDAARRSGVRGAVIEADRARLDILCHGARNLIAQELIAHLLSRPAPTE